MSDAMGKKAEVVLWLQTLLVKNIAAAADTQLVAYAVCLLRRQVVFCQGSGRDMSTAKPRLA